MITQEEINKILDWTTKYKQLLVEGQNLQVETALHLKLSIEKLLKYANTAHFKLHDREFLENVLKKNSELFSHYNKIVEPMDTLDYEGWKVFDVDV